MSFWCKVRFRLSIRSNCCFKQTFSTWSFSHCWLLLYIEKQSILLLVFGDDGAGRCSCLFSFCGVLEECEWRRCWSPASSHLSSTSFSARSTWSFSVSVVSKNTSSSSSSCSAVLRSEGQQGLPTNEIDGCIGTGNIIDGCNITDDGDAVVVTFVLFVFGFFFFFFKSSMGCNGDDDDDNGFATKSTLVRLVLVGVTK